jgi:hypothetical protein
VLLLPLLLQNGCNSFCSHQCATNLACDPATFTCKCVPTCTGPIDVGLSESCGK